jgi:hypothetical protein
MATRCLRLLLFFLALGLLVNVSGQQSRRRQQQRGTSPDSSTPGNVLIRFEGTLTFASKKEIRIDVEGDQSLDFRVTKKTAFYRGKAEITPKDLAANSHIVIEGRRELNGDLDAVNVWADEPNKEVDEPAKEDTKKP